MNKKRLIKLGIALFITICLSSFTYNFMRYSSMLAFQMDAENCTVMTYDPDKTKGIYERLNNPKPIDYVYKFICYNITGVLYFPSMIDIEYDENSVYKPPSIQDFTDKEHKEIESNVID